ncbi:MAG: TrkA family potassium uptake protein [Chloroflexi bacterium]|nr:TrkA family potassium uptake protein [Chloroflexota bacterium]
MRQRQHRPEFAVIGLGRFGTSLALALLESGYSVLGIDQDAELAQRLVDDLTQIVILDATDEDALREVDIASFDTVIVAIGADFESNLLTTVSLKHLGVRYVISKAVTNRQAEILLRVGADEVIQPEQEAGRRLAQQLTVPAVLARLHLGPQHDIVELMTPSSIAGKSLQELDLRRRMGVTVLLIKRDNDLIVSPRADTPLLESDLLVAVGSNEALEAFGKLP